nr:CaiB/BaiF CoA-transferase family protein [Rhodococcus sp. (in: high G+C Gram-positive bacteria)]
MTELPLAGIVVVAVEQAVAVPFATRQLADLGARVIKIERPGTGDFARGYDDKVSGISSAFVWLNRGKESIELDIKSRSGRAVLDALLGRADIFLHNISPSAARRQGLDSATLAALHPTLICGSVSGYGSGGPLSDAKAYDLLIQGEAGLMSLNGDKDNFAKVGISVADIAAGMYVYSSALAALFHRSRTNEALPIDVSLFDSLAEWLSYPMYYTKHGGTAPERMGTSHATIAPYGGFETADGQRILLAVQNDREWRRFCDAVMERAEFAIDPRFGSHAARVDNRLALDDEIARTLREIDYASLVKRLDAADIAYARMNTIDQLATHEQLDSRGRWTPTGSEVGDIDTLLPPWFPENHVPRFGSIPSLGEHTEQVLDWIADDLELPPPTTATQERAMKP